MKRESLGWFVAGAVIVLTCTLGAMQQQGGVGRFQIVEGTFQMTSAKEGGIGLLDVPTVWRIDTVTGEAVMYFATIDKDGTERTGWGTVVGRYGAN